MSTRNSIIRTTVAVVATSALAVAIGCNKTETTNTKAPAPAADKMTTDTMTIPAPTAPTIPTQPERDPATVLVTVGGEKLTVGEVEKQLAPMMAQAGGDPRMASMKGRFYQQAAERFVIRSLLTQEADKRKIAVNDGDVTEAMSMITNRLPAGMTLDDALARDGISTAQFRSNLTAELRIKKLVETEVPTNTAVSDQEVADFYAQQKERFTAPESVAARHILIKSDKSDNEAVRAEKKAKVDGLRKQLVEGADFAKLAKENSDCPSKERGGDLGTFGRGQMVKPFEDAAFGQATNVIGPVVETDFGYHIIQVTAHKQAGTTSLAEVKPRLAEYLKQKKQMQAFETFLSGLKSKAEIVYDDSVKPQPRDAGMMQQDADEQ